MTDQWLRFASGARARLAPARAVRGSDDALPPICFPDDDEPSTCTVSVGSTDDPPPFEPAVSINITRGNLADHAADRVTEPGHPSERRPFETIDVPDDWTPEDIGAALERAKAAGQAGVTLVVGDAERMAEGLAELQHTIGAGLLPAVTVLARRLIDIAREAAALCRPRRSRQDGPRARNGIRLRVRRGESTATYDYSTGWRGHTARLVEHIKESP